MIRVTKRILDGSIFHQCHLSHFRLKYQLRCHPDGYVAMGRREKSNPSPFSPCSQAHVSIRKEAPLWGNPDLLQERQEVSPGCALEVLPCTVEGAFETGLAVEVMSYDYDPTDWQRGKKLIGLGVP